MLVRHSDRLNDFAVEDSDLKGEGTVGLTKNLVDCLQQQIKRFTTVLAIHWASGCKLEKQN